MYRVRVATLDTFPAKMDSMDSLFVVDSVGYFLAVKSNLTLFV